MQRVGIRYFSREKCKVVQDCIMTDRSKFQELKGTEREEEEDRLQNNLKRHGSQGWIVKSL